VRCDVCGGNGARPIVMCYEDLFLCKECRNRGIVPWDVLVGVVCGLGMQAAQTIESNIEATCHYYGRLVEELWAEVDFAQHQYAELMKQQEEQGNVGSTRSQR